MTPVISKCKKDIDGIYYWTVNGDWLIVDGNKVKAVGTDGANGEMVQMGKTELTEKMVQTAKME